jgi:L-aspartate oxidase
MIIIGGGVAGLMAALAAAPAPVLLLDPALGNGCASAWAQGGLAAALGDDDSADRHIADTLAAGAGLCDSAAVSRIIRATPETVDLLLSYGVKFDRAANGDFSRGLEAAHSRPRILHAGGDQTGAEIMRALIAAVRRTPSITILPSRAEKILVGGSGVEGVLTGTECLPAEKILLATGGIGGLFSHSTNPENAIGHGLMLAAAAGAKLQNLEFIQFHPTALDIDAASLPLISEAVRGDGAVFIDEHGETFMQGEDLAPRDVVSRAVFAHQQAGHRTFLDARMIANFAQRFPAISAICARAGIDPSQTPIPVRPAAHYHMGGVQVDAAGLTSVPGLFAAGEVACTGLHGANRLASNSLLEAAVCGTAAGRAMAAAPKMAPPHRAAPPAARITAAPLPLDLAPRRVSALPAARAPAGAAAPPAETGAVDALAQSRVLPPAHAALLPHDPARTASPPPDPAPVRAILSAHLNVQRSAAGLHQAIAELSPLAATNAAAALGLLIAQAALAREQSIGAHARADAAAPLHQAA